jgi:hypothetical protein
MAIGRMLVALGALAIAILPQTAPADPSFEGCVVVATGATPFRCTYRTTAGGNTYYFAASSGWAVGVAGETRSDLNQGGPYAIGPTSESVWAGQMHAEPQANGFAEVHTGNVLINHQSGVVAIYTAPMDRDDPASVFALGYGDGTSAFFPGAAGMERVTPLETYVGQRLIFHNTTQVSHSITQDSTCYVYQGTTYCTPVAFNSGIVGPGESAEVAGIETFLVTGESLRFHCSVHPTMKGFIRVV